MKTLPLRLKNKFEGLVIDDTDSDIVDTGCTTPINGVTPTEHGAAEACLIPCQINYIVTICYVKRFISKLKEHISWLKPKHYFIQTTRPQSELMINVGLHTMDTHRMVDVMEQPFNNYFSFCPCLLLLGFVDNIIKVNNMNLTSFHFIFVCPCLAISYLLSPYLLISYLLIFLSLAHILLEDIWTISYWLISLG